jgi:hypothetical protein
MPASQITNPAGLLGQTGTQSVKTDDLVMATAVSANEVVALSTSAGYGIRCLSDTAANIAIGVATETAAIGEVCTVITYGVATTKKGTAAITAGNIVNRDATVSGTVKAATQAVTDGITLATAGFFGTALASATAGDATAVIYVGHI